MKDLIEGMEKKRKPYNSKPWKQYYEGLEWAYEILHADNTGLELDFRDVNEANKLLTSNFEELQSQHKQVCEDMEDFKVEVDRLDKENKELKKDSDPQLIYNFKSRIQELEIALKVLVEFKKGV